MQGILKLIARGSDACFSRKPMRSNATNYDVTTLEFKSTC